MKYPLTSYKTQPLLALTQPTWTEVFTCSLFPALLSLGFLPGVGIWQESCGVWAASWMYCMTPLLLPPLSNRGRQSKGFAYHYEEKGISYRFIGGWFLRSLEIESLENRKFEHVQRCAVKRCTVHCTYR
jgi:hypothetical protein